MRQPFMAIALLGASVASWTGCAKVAGETVGELSENLAVVDRKAVANKPEFNDGNRYTSSVTTSEMTERGNPNWMEKEKYSVALVELPEATKVHKIIFYTKDVDRNLARGMYVSVDYQDPQGSWKTIRRWDRSPVPRDIIVNCNVTAKKVRLQIRRPPALFGGGGGAGGGGGGGIKDRGDRSIYEVEVYQYLPKAATAPSEKPPATSR